MRASILAILLLLLFAVIAFAFRDEEFDDFDGEEVEDGASATTVLSHAPVTPVEREEVVQQAASVPAGKQDERGFYKVKPRKAAPKASKPVSYDDFDDEEFEGYEAKVSEAEPDVASALPLAPKFASLQPQEHFMFELAAITFLVVYGINYFIGRRHNRELVDAWVVEFSDMFRSQFARVGTGEVPSLASGVSPPVVLMDSASAYTFFASGRIHCQSLTAYLELKRRQDLLSVFTDLFSDVSDTITIEVLMDSIEMDPLTFLLAKPGTPEKTQRKNWAHLERYSQEFKAENYGLSSILSLRAESADILSTKMLLPEHIRTVFKLYASRILYVHISDQMHPLPPGLEQPAHHSDITMMPTQTWKMLTFSFTLPPADKMHELSRLMKASIDMIDIVAVKAKLTPTLRTRADQRRQEVVDGIARKQQREKNEEERKKLAKEKKEQEAERIKSLSKEAQARIEEKQRKAKAKSMLPKMKTLHG